MSDTRSDSQVSLVVTPIPFASTITGPIRDVTPLGEEIDENKLSEELLQLCDYFINNIDKYFQPPPNSMYILLYIVNTLY